MIKYKLIRLLNEYFKRYVVIETADVIRLYLPNKVIPYSLSFFLYEINSEQDRFEIKICYLPWWQNWVVKTAWITADNLEDHSGADILPLHSS